ncbi:MAG TPA: transposase, partial [Ktedonobacterales bacterium]
VVPQRQLTSYGVGRAPLAEQDFAAHETVDHGRGEYAKDSASPANGRAHINTAEGYSSQLKCSIDGTYHHVSERHLNRYLADFGYRYNTRKVNFSACAIAFPLFAARSRYPIVLFALSYSPASCCTSPPEYLSFLSTSGNALLPAAYTLSALQERTHVYTSLSTTYSYVHLRFVSHVS